MYLHVTRHGLTIFVITVRGAPEIHSAGTTLSPGFINTWTVNNVRSLEMSCNPKIISF